jgi:predicted transporter
MENKSLFDKVKLNVARWYEYSRHQIPVILTILSSVILTSTMRTHIQAITPLFSAESGFYMFVVMMLSALIMFTVLAFGKTQSPVSSVVFSVVTLVQHFVIYQYIALIIFETTTGVIREGVNQVVNRSSSMNQSIGIMIIAGVLYLVANIFAWLYTNYKYVKVAE